jgi:hypothetical protein
VALTKKVIFNLQIDILSFICCYFPFDFRRAIHSSFFELFNELQSFVFVSVLYNVQALLVFSVEVDIALGQKEVNTICVSAFYGIKYRRLPIVIHMVRICTMLNKNSHYSSKPFSGSIKYWSLTKAVDMVCLAAMGQE